MQNRWKRLRDEAYSQGAAEFAELAKCPTFREFVALYVAEGYKRDRNVASVANSDPAVVTLVVSSFGRLTPKTPVIRVQYHREQDPAALTEFWSMATGLPVEAIRLQPKSKSACLRADDGAVSTE